MTIMTEDCVGTLLDSESAQIVASWVKYPYFVHIICMHSRSRPLRATWAGGHEPAGIHAASGMGGVRTGLLPCTKYSYGVIVYPYGYY